MIFLEEYKNNIKKWRKSGLSEFDHMKLGDIVNAAKKINKNRSASYQIVIIYPYDILLIGVCVLY